MEDSIYRPEILLVEDDEIMRVTVSDHLRKKGWTVTVAEDGMLGMEQLKKKDFDIVICDIRLPKKTAWNCSGRPGRPHPRLSLL